MQISSLQHIFLWLSFVPEDSVIFLFLLVIVVFGFVCVFVLDVRGACPNGMAKLDQFFGYINVLEQNYSEMSADIS